MKPKRFTFKCWDCGKTYTLLREITKEQKLTVACPYCNAEGVVDLAPFLKKVERLVRGDAEVVSDNNLPEEFDLPDVLPTQKSE